VTETLVIWRNLSPKDPGHRAPSAPERIRHEWLQREAGPSFLTPRSDALALADARGLTLSRLGPPASERSAAGDPDRAYVRLLLDGPESAPRVAVAVRDPAARPDAPNAPSTALLAAVVREGIAA
jgi:hypothetical protein